MLQRIFKLHFQNIEGSTFHFFAKFVKHFRYKMIWKQWGRIGDTLGTHWGRIGNALETLLGRIGDALGTHRGCFEDALGTHWGHIGDTLGSLIELQC